MILRVHVLMRDEKEEKRKKQGQTNNKANQHSTPKAVTFPKKNELPRVGLEPTTLYTLDRALLDRSLQSQSQDQAPVEVADWAQHGHVLCHEVVEQVGSGEDGDVLFWRY